MEIETPIISDMKIKYSKSSNKTYGTLWNIENHNQTSFITKRTIHTK